MQETLSRYLDGAVEPPEHAVNGLPKNKIREMFEKALKCNCGWIVHRQHS